MNNDRQSYTEQREVVADPIERARREVENGFRQYELMVELIRKNVKTGARFKLQARHIMQLQNAALAGLDPLAGTFRNTPVLIRRSNHSPPDQFSVPDEVAALCDYVNLNWGHSAVHLAAYILWRLNWIHPFSDGNGRTARAISYPVLCIRLDGLLPGAPTIPEQIAANKAPYYDALERADKALEEERIDVSALERLLSEMLANQLLSIAALSEATEDKLKAIVAGRVDRAARQVLERIYSSDKPQGRTWQHAYPVNTHIP